MSHYRDRGGDIVDAFRWTGDADQQEDPDWIIERLASGEACWRDLGTPGVTMLVESEEGTKEIERGRWIVRLPDGDIISCSEEAFGERFSPAFETMS